MSTTNRITLRALRIAPLFTLLLTVPALAGGEEWYPVNPYHEKTYPVGGREESRGTGLRTAPRFPVELLREYPQGPNGPRVVKLVLSHADLLGAENRTLEIVRANEQAAARDLREADDRLTDLRRRLSWLEPQRADSIEQYEAWMDLVEEVQRLEDFTARARAYVDNCRQYQTRVAQQLSRPQPTTVVWNVLNQQNREYVPTDYLRTKAIEHVLANPDRVGATTYLNF